MKTGRNDPCPCGSGIKYKKCHAKQVHSDEKKSETVDAKLLTHLPIHIQRNILEHEARQKRFKMLYGNVKPIISIDHKGHKFVAVGNRLHFSKKWKTFHDFLFDYMITCLTPEWGNAELKKDFSERHPIIQWYQYLCEFQRHNITKEGEIYSAICTGPVGAYLSLAYDLYILRHHSLLQSKLIDRLKDKNQFQGARYEIYVAAVFVKAGFDIEFEDEADKSKSHCEFIATHKSTSRRYSIEAKSRHRPGLLGRSGEARNHEEIKLRIGGLLRDALKKKADYTRIIFMDVNMPPGEGDPRGNAWFESLNSEITRIESETMTGIQYPAAYLVFTNHPYHYVGKDEVEPRKNHLLTAVNLPHFKIYDPERAQAIDPPIFMLFDSVIEHTRVPCDFNE